MPYDKFIIGPFDKTSGLQTNVQPFMISDDAYASLNNAYIWRGRVRKRFGSTYMIDDQTDSRLRVQLGTVAGLPSPTPVPGGFGKIGQMFSIGTTFFTVYQTIGPMFTTGVATGTFNVNNGFYTFADTGGFPGATPIWWYPANPVMGITQYEIESVNNHPTFAFDTQFAYTFTPNLGWEQPGNLGNAQWHGKDTNFFWSTTWEGLTDNTQILFTTNFNAAVPTPAPLTDDPIRFWDGNVWNDFTPKFLNAGIDPVNTVQSARIIVAFKDRLLLLNTIERNATGANLAFVNRCRFSQNGSPIQGANPTYEPAWLELTQAGSQGAGYVDATTEEAIISAEFIKDRLIVYFERSTWELAYTGNEILPFKWQKINTELGSMATDSSVPFDKVVLTVGATGIHACNGANVERIDSIIPDEIYSIQLANLAESRVAGIRDYYTEMVYWTIPALSPNTLPPYPNRVIVYNYKTGTWAFNDDCITAFGYFEQQGDQLWVNTDETWESSTQTWSSGVTQANFRVIVAGNQQGFVYRIEPDKASNEHVMQVTNAVVNVAGLNFTIINHTLAAGDYFHIQGQSVGVGQTDINGNFAGVVIAPVFHLGQYFVIGNNVYTSVTEGVAQPLQVTLPSIGTGTYDTVSGALVINNSTPLTDIIAYITPGAFQLQPNSTDTNNIYLVDSVIDANTVFVNNITLITPTPITAGWTVARVSNVNFLSKQWNFYNKEDSNFSIQKIDFNVTKTTSGEITVDYYPSSTELSMIQEAQDTESILGTGILETSPYDLLPLEAVQEFLWHPLYFQCVGESIQLYFYFSENQMMNPNVVFSEFELNSLIVYAIRSGRMQ
jgi:hypothetical protein